ncbi:hypothetical protein SK128_017015 [Halocaridina rubra]|uniref:NTF2 domain-containing protein n=1 Tax=Halocaridina rubra TaxID=373956 RepID=A0AAN8XBL7_HALRR
MGRKSKRKHQIKKQREMEKMFDEVEDISNMNLNDFKGRNAKERSKLRRKELKKMRKVMRHRCDNQKGASSKSGWQKIVIVGDTPLEKDFVFSSISNYIDTEFRPLGFYRYAKTSGFYLENNPAAALAIVGLNKRLQGPDGSRLKITSQTCDTPDLILNADQIQLLRECLSRRYDVSTCMLDLSSLHKDLVLMEKDILAPLSSSAIMKQVLKIIKENVQEVKALNMSRNSLRKGDVMALQNLQNGNSQLAALNLEHNHITDLKLLNALKVFPLVELNMQFNPVVDNFKEKPLIYIKEVRARLKSLAILDGVDIDKYLSENDKPVLSNPKMNINFSHNEHILCGPSNDGETSVPEEIIQTFLREYYNLIDTPQREELLAAYTPDAVLEIKSSIDAITSSVFVGHEKISAALSLFPATQHHHDTFSFNIQPLGGTRTAQADIIGQCQIVGIDGLVRFHRTMNIVPFNTGYCCAQDIFVLKLIGT